MLEGPLKFSLSHSVCMYVWMDDGCRFLINKKKVNPHFSKENAMTDFRKTWNVGSVDTSTTHVVVVCRHRMCIFNTSFVYLF